MDVIIVKAFCEICNLQGIQYFLRTQELQETRDRIDAGTAAAAVEIVFVFDRSDPPALRQQQE